MGRGKHTTHKEDRISISTKLPLSIWLKLTKKKPEVIFNASKYIRELILEDIK